MRHPNELVRGAAWKLPAAFLLAFAVATAALASPSNKWRVQLGGSAKVDGEVELSFTPKDGTASSVVVAIPKGTHENSAARLVRDAIKAQFGKDVYKVETDDGEDVLVKKRGKTPDFEVTVVRNTAEGLRVSLDRE
ncbi:hypothetical protein [Pseudoxanthomonas koreensis]|uniref:hypothetical protein n=1 Tax=Pseudoxanthomonas koreensis TaxID=266061 RepID=UPI0013907E51|nr:hypothetical protein [Pseudoxanthomonas koreensis]KAF1689190.1 hypothetical protein CSC64_13035 [Pseudoxanthomonas koreensis]